MTADPLPTGMPDSAGPNAADPFATGSNPVRNGHAEAEQPWRRLAPGMLLVEPVRDIIRFIPMLIVLLFAGRAGESGPPWGLIGTLAVIALGISRWLTTRYRITPTVVEVRRGLFRRKHLTVPRDRVRTVDVSAHPLQRLLRLTKVQIGTGTSHIGAESLVLDGLRASAATPLRAELLHRVRPAPGFPGPGFPAPGAAPGATPSGDNPSGDNPSGDNPESFESAPVNSFRPPPASAGARDPDPQIDPNAETELARLDPRWIRYAPATMSGVVTGAVLLGFGWRIINEASVDPTRFGVVHQTLRYLQSTPLWLDILQGAAVVIIAVTLLSLAGYVLSFWGFRLTRHTGGTLQISRGLLTTRSTSIEERRLHGVERTEPLLLRAVGGARLQAIATGLRQRGSDRGSALLVPPAPLETVVAVETAVVGSDKIAQATLTPHGPAARRRRFSRALGLTALPIVALFALAFTTYWPAAPAVVSLLALPAAALLARDRYSNLGHLVVHDRLITRVGSLVRRRSVIAVSGVIGVTLRQSVFQRRSGLISLTATTAAGSQHYEVPDLTTVDAIDLAVRLVPQSRGFTDATPPVARDGPGSALLRDEPGVSRLPA